MDGKFKYGTYAYWTHLFDRTGGDVEGFFRERKITEDTVFSHQSIVDYYREEPHDSNIIFPNVWALLGFVQYIFLPTAISTLLRRHGEVDYPGMTSEETFDYLKRHDLIKDEVLADEIMNITRDVASLWSEDEKHCFDELQMLMDKFNALTLDEREAFAALDLFQSPKEFGEYVIDTFDLGDGTIDEDMLEEELLMSKEDFEYICDHVMDNEVMERRFIKLFEGELPTML
ncbi:MAG: hypothetical protein N4A40_01825 [Tissierellales bacterium]|nr:hypothetical protein [Tissierellales bacterium]